MMIEAPVRTLSIKVQNNYALERRTNNSHSSVENLTKIYIKFQAIEIILTKSFYFFTGANENEAKV